MEIPLKNIELPVFSDKFNEFAKENQFVNFHDYENELVDKIIQRDQRKGKKVEKNIEVEHHYIDFQIMIIGEKIRQMKQMESGRLKFDDLYFAKLMS